MRIIHTFLIATGASLSLAAINYAQDGNGRPPGGPGGEHRPPPPIIAALDLNGDGEISADEIAKAADSLKKLDKNGDGKLSGDEIHPPHPPGGPDGGPGKGHHPKGPDGGGGKPNQ